MIAKYYVIPNHYEAVLSAYQTAWLEQSESSYICLNGEYEKTVTAVEEETEYTTVKDQQGQFIALHFCSTDMEGDLHKFSLRFFLLEALEKDVPILPSDVLIFETANEVLDYIHNSDNIL